MYDAFIILIIAVFLILGLKRGFVRSVSSVLSLALSIFTIFHFHDEFSVAIASSPVGEKVSELVFSNYDGLFAKEAVSVLVSIVGIIIMYLVVKIVIKVFVNILDLVAKLPLISLVNKLLGAVMGAFSGTLWSVLITNVLAFFPKVIPLIEASKIVHKFDFLLFFK